MHTGTTGWPGLTGQSATREDRIGGCGRGAGIVELAHGHDTEGELRSGRADVELQRTLLGEAIDEAPVLVFVADEDGRYVAVNRHACEILGYSRRQLLGMTVSEVAVAPEAADLHAAMLEQGRLEATTPVRCSDGRLLPLRFWAKAVRVGGVEFWLSVGVIEPPAPTRVRS
jgi:PAS domain S-box-containing protein